MRPARDMASLIVEGAHPSYQHRPSFMYESKDCGEKCRIRKEAQPNSQQVAPYEMDFRWQTE